MAGGRPREYDRDAILAAFEQYVDETEIPIVAEFASIQYVTKQYLYDCPEFSDVLKRCTSKKEAALERHALSGDVNCTMAIFSLKQLGWTDRTEQTHKGDKAHPLVVSMSDSKL